MAMIGDAGTESPQSNRASTQPPSGGLSFVIEFLKIFILAAAIIVPIRLFLVQPFYVKGASMEPNFFENEYLIIDKLTPNFRAYARGEVIVFRYPKNENRFLIKRVIGLPGEKVSISHEKVTIFNASNLSGFSLDESTYHPYPIRPESQTTRLSDHQYYVLGDNRPVSYDSERFGPVDAEQIVGRVVFRGLPIHRISLLKTPTYSNADSQ